MPAVHIDELLKSKTRPNIMETAKYKDAINFKLDELASGNRLDLNRFKQSLEKGAPEFIVKLEKAYPEAVFMFLGRDTQLIADVVDAFYNSIGQPGRVRQIGVSGPTLAGLSDAKVMKYLEQFGISVAEIQKAKRPLVFVDTISSGSNIGGVLVSGRQGRNLLQIIFNQMMLKGLIVKDYLRKINMIGLRVSTFSESAKDNKFRYDQIENLDKINSENEKRLNTNDVNNKNVGRDFKMGLIKDTRRLFNESGYDHFTSTWHGKYQAPAVKGSKLILNPGDIMPEKHRKAVLWMQKEVINFVFNENFKNRVFLAAEKAGVNFSGQTPSIKIEVIHPMISPEEKLKLDLIQVMNTSKVLSEKKSFTKIKVGNEKLNLTINARKVVQILTAAGAFEVKDYYTIVLKTLNELYQKDKIGARDYRRIMAHIITVKPIEDRAFLNEVQKTYRDVLPLEIMLAKPEMRSEYLKQGGTGQENYLKLINNGKLKISCNMLF